LYVKVSCFGRRSWQLVYVAIQTSHGCELIREGINNGLGGLTPFMKKLEEVFILVYTDRADISLQQYQIATIFLFDNLG
jgi:hypothetical protein